MKEIIAIIRPRKAGATRDALDQAGFPGMTAEAVLGRGKQRGIAGEVACEIPQVLLAPGKTGSMKYVPKRMLSIVVRDEDVDRVVNTILQVNRTGQIGDGRIFICPLENVVRVRTDESGDGALL